MKDDAVDSTTNCELKILLVKSFRNTLFRSIVNVRLNAIALITQLGFYSLDSCGRLIEPMMNITPAMNMFR